MKYRRFLIVTVAVSILSGLIALAPPLLMQCWQNDGVTAQRIFLLVCVIAGGKAVSIGLICWRERFARNYNRRNFARLLRSALSMDYDTICAMGPSTLLERISMSVNGIYSYMTGDFLRLISSLVTIVVCLCLIAAAHPAMALPLLLLLPVNYFGYRLLNRELARRSQTLQTETSAGFQDILSRISQVDFIKQLPDYGPLLHAIEPATARMYGSMADVNEYAQCASAALAALNEIAQAVILLSAACRFLDGGSAFAMLLAGMVLPLYFSALHTVVNANLDRHSFRTAQSFEQELAAHREPDGDTPAAPIETLHIEVNSIPLSGRNLPFSASAELKKGDIVKICGASGCGKSSFARALMKFRPISGIRVNGVPLERLQNAGLRARIEYVPQNAPIIAGTLRENFFLGTEPTGDAEQRLRAMPLLSGILQSKDLDSEILEGGANLSGGEKQKIALARALVRDADVLILDEICSNIDRTAANDIYAFLEADRKKRITLLISHDALPDGFANICLNA